MVSIAEKADFFGLAVTLSVSTDQLTLNLLGCARATLSYAEKLVNCTLS